MVVRCTWPATLSLGLEAKLNVEVGEAGVFLSLKTDSRHQITLHCGSCIQCLLLGPDVDGSSVQEEEKA